MKDGKVLTFNFFLNLYKSTVLTVLQKQKSLKVQIKKTKQ